MDQLQQLTLLSTQPNFSESTPTSSQNSYLTIIQDLAEATAPPGSTSTTSNYIYPKIVAYPDSHRKDCYIKYRNISPSDSNVWSYHNDADTVANATFKMSRQFSLWWVRSCRDNFIHRQGTDKSASGNDENDDVDEDDDSKDDENKKKEKVEKYNTVVCILQTGSFIILDPMYKQSPASSSYTRLRDIPGIATVKALYKKLTDPKTPKIARNKSGKGVKVDDIYYGPGLVAVQDGDGNGPNSVLISQQTIRMIAEGGFSVDTSGYKKLGL